MTTPLGHGMWSPTIYIFAVHSSGGGSHKRHAPLQVMKAKTAQADTQGPFQLLSANSGHGRSGLSCFAALVQSSQRGDNRPSAVGMFFIPAVPAHHDPALFSQLFQLGI